MARPNVRVTILCEDKSHEHFVRKVCEHYGLSPVRVVIAPRGRGSAEGWVRKQYPGEVQRLRQAKHELVALIAITDGDKFGVSERKKGFAASLTAKSMLPRMNDERIAILVPTWSIETWLLWLCGIDDVKEDASYKDTPKWRHAEASPTKAAAGYVLAPQQEESPRVPSLLDGRIEMKRVIVG